MTTLVEFLLARIGEDEAVARAADAEAALAGVFDDPFITHTSKAVAEHVARFDPARVLAECEAKRRLIDLHRSERFEDEPTESFCSHDQRTAGVWPCATVRLLALPYADHPDYDEAWKA